MDANEQFTQQVRENIAGISSDPFFQYLSNLWLREAGTHQWSYNFSGLGGLLFNSQMMHGLCRN